MRYKHKLLLQTVRSLDLMHCRARLDSFGHHRAACSVAGVLGKRVFPLKQTAAQVHTEAGAKVRTNSFIRDMDLEGVNVLDGRRFEVVADGMTLSQRDSTETSRR